MSENTSNRKRIQKMAKKRYRFSHHTYCLNFSLDDAKELEKAAAKHKMKVPKYIKLILKASNQHPGYFVPDTDMLQSIVLQIKRIGNNTNQLVKYCHSVKGVQYSDIETINKQLKELETVIATALTNPPEITEIVFTYLKQNPEKRAILFAWFYSSNDH